MQNEFLERQLEQRELIVAQYDEKVAVVEEKKVAYELAQEELQALGNVEQAKAEIIEIKAIIEQLNPSAVVEAPEEVEELQPEEEQ